MRPKPPPCSGSPGSHSGSAGGGFEASLPITTVYLIVFGSLIAYTAYVWLLGRTSATRVASHAYVNPVVAVALGYFAAGELITMRTVLAAGLVIVSVFLILSKGASPAK